MSARPGRWVSWAVRIAALLLALAYLPLALVWAYWIAAIAAVLPLGALTALRAMARREHRAGAEPPPGLRRLHHVATFLCWSGLATALLALLFTLLAG